MNHKRCILYQDLISTYHKSCVQNLVISAKSEHRKGLYTFFTSQELCEPQWYIRMLDTNHKEALEYLIFRCKSMT